MLPKAAASAADVVIVDLEDAVAVGEKDAARKNLIAQALDLPLGHAALGYRINPIGSPWCLADLVDVVGSVAAAIDVVVVPKVSSARDVWFVDDVLASLEASAGLETGSIGLELLVEEAEAVLDIRAIASASPRLEALVIGMGDLAASLGMRIGHVGDTAAIADVYPGDPWHSVRATVIAAARATGVEAIDGPYARFDDEHGLSTSSAQFAALGGSGRWCIHPRQVGVVNEMFSPTEAEIAEAEAVVEAGREAAEQHLGAVSLNGRMIDAATTRAFGNVLQRANEIERRSGTA